MDGLDLFRKLGSGAKFDFKRFHQDAEKLKLVKPMQKTECSEKNTADFFAGKGCVSKEGDASGIVSKKRRNLEEDSETNDSIGDQEDDMDDDGMDSEQDDDVDEDDDEPEPELHLLGSMKAKSSQDPSEADLKKKRKKQKKKTSAKLAELKQEQINHFRRQHRIHVHGTDVPDPVETFQQLEKDYGMHHQVVQNLRTVGFSAPTPIQMQAVPVMLQRREVLACAPTGSGKTAAFILPILHHLVEPRRQNVRALVLSPTRELAKQTYREFSRLGEGRGFRVNFIEKTSSFQKSRGKSLNKFDILVTTPNRLIFLLKQEPPMINLAHVEWLIVDESDKLFEEGKTGFRDQLAVIYNACDSKNVRRAMFSATFAYEVEQWCKLNLDNVVQVYIGARNVASETVEQELQFVGSESGKLLAVQDIIRKGLQPPVLIFVQSKERAKELFHELIYDGINVDVIHADRTQLQRDNIVKGFRAGKIWVLICTELMGRGIDFKGVNLVINYDFPNSAISYIHRIGRTGRAGRRGKAVTFFTENDAVYLRSIANIMRETGCPVPEYMLKINKPTKKERRKLAKKAPKRKTIRTFPKDEIVKAKKRQKLLKSLEHRGAPEKVGNSKMKDTQSKRKLSVEKKKKILQDKGKKENPLKSRQKKKPRKKSKTEQ